MIGWGSSLFLMNILLDSLTPNEIVMYRMAIGFFTLFIFACLFCKQKIEIKPLIFDGVIVGLFNSAIPFYFTVMASQHIGVALSAILNALTPLFTFLLSILLFSSEQRISIIYLLNLLLGFVGVLCINFNFSVNDTEFYAVLALIIVSVSYAFAANYIKYRIKTNHPLWISTLAAFVSTLIMFVFHLLTMENKWNMPTSFNQLLALMWLGIISSGLCLYLYFVLIKRIGAKLASMVTYLMVLTGVLLGVIYLHEQMPFVVKIGCALIMISLVMSYHSDFLIKQILKLNLVRVKKY